MSWKGWQETFEFLKNGVETLAFIAAAGWFAYQGLSRPRLKIEHRIVHKPFNDGSKKVHVVADVFLSNVGNVRIDIPCGEIWVKQILPAPKPGQISANRVLKQPDKTVDGHLCSFTHYSIEPGEGDQVHYPFDVDESVQAIQFDSFVPHSKKIGWGLQSFYDLSAPGAVKTYQDATPAQAQQKSLPAETK